MRGLFKVKDQSSKKPESKLVQCLKFNVQRNGDGYKLQRIPSAPQVSWGGLLAARMEVVARSKGGTTAARTTSGQQELPARIRFLEMNAGFQLDFKMPEFCIPSRKASS